MANNLNQNISNREKLEQLQKAKEAQERAEAERRKKEEEERLAEKRRQDEERAAQKKRQAEIVERAKREEKARQQQAKEYERKIDQLLARHKNSQAWLYEANQLEREVRNSSASVLVSKSSLVLLTSRSELTRLHLRKKERRKDSSKKVFKAIGIGLLILLGLALLVGAFFLLGTVLFLSILGGLIAVGGIIGAIVAYVRAPSYTQDTVKKVIGIILWVLLNAAAAALAVYTYFVRDAVLLFKIAFGLVAAVAVVNVVVAICHRGRYRDRGIRNTGILLALACAVGAYFMYSSGRLLGGDLLRADDGFVYTEVNGAYYLHGCDGSVTELVLSELSEEIAGISSGALKGNTTLTSVVLDVPTLTIGANAFADCSALTEVTVIGGDHTIGDGAFKNCKKLQSVRFEGGSYQFEGSGVFSGCDRLTDIYMIGGSYTSAQMLTKPLSGLGNVAVHHDNAEIGMALTGVKELTLVVYPGTYNIFAIEPDVLVFAEGFDFDSWTDERSASEIGPLAPKIYLPSTVTQLPDRMFGSDSESYDVYYRGSRDQWESISIPGLDGWIFGSNSNYSRELTRMHYDSTCRYWQTNDTEVEN